MKTQYNKASTDILLVSSLRSQLTQADTDLLKSRLSVSAVDSEKAKKIQKAADYLSCLSEIQIDQDSLPQSLPPPSLFIETLVGVTQVSSKKVLIAASLMLMLSLGYWKFSSLEVYDEPLASTVFAKKSSPLGDQNIELVESGVLAVQETSKGLEVQQEAKEGSVAVGFNQTQDKVSGGSSIAEVKVAPKKQEIALKDRSPSSIQESSGVRVTGNTSDNAFVVRAFLTVKDQAVGKNEVTEFLSQFNPKKAGQVELGWEKAPNVIYYHFLTQEESEVIIKSGLAKLGRLRWSKEPHPRKLEVGSSRIILEVELDTIK